MEWLAGIRAFEDEIHDLASWRKAMAGWINLDDGRIVRGGREIGRWVMSDASEPLGDHGCPLVGPRIGSIAFDIYPWMASEDDRHELFCGLFKEGRDAVWHAPTRRRWPALTLQTRTLDSCIRKCSLDDGAELLTRNDGAYAAWTRDAFAKPLRDAGYWVHMSWPATSHNTLRLSAIEVENGQLLPAIVRDGEAAGDWDTIDRVLEKFSTELWLFDFENLRAIVEDPGLWGK